MPTYTSTTTARAVATALAVTTTLGLLSGCGWPDASDAEPETRTFPFDGDVLDVKANRTHTDLVPADRDDVQVTRRIDTLGSPNIESSWSLEDDTLLLENSCDGICVYEDHFRVEVPEGLRVLRDGEPTDLEGQ